MPQTFVDDRSADQDREASLAHSGGMSDLSPEVKKKIEALINNQLRMKLDKEAMKDDVAAVAKEMGCKPGDVNALVTTIISEREKGGIIASRERALEWARQMVDDEES